MKTQRVNAEHETLVQILAARDAFWSVQRRFRGNAPANVFVLRRDYLASGGAIAWVSHKASASQRRAAQRSLESLAADGLIDVAKAGGRTVGVILTDAGEMLAQCLAAVPALYDDWPWVIFDAIRRRECAVPEDHLLGLWRDSFQPSGDGWTRSRSLSLLEAGLVPFLCRRWLMSGSTLYSSARYWTGPLPDEATRPSREFITEVLGGDDWEGAAGAAVYQSAYSIAYGALVTEPPSDMQEIGTLPLSVAASDFAELEAWRRSEALAADGK